MCPCFSCCVGLHFACGFFFFFNDTATTEIYTLSLHDALPISGGATAISTTRAGSSASSPRTRRRRIGRRRRSEEHTSELQSLAYLVCRLLLEKKKRSKMSEAMLSSVFREKNIPNRGSSRG